MWFFKSVICVTYYTALYCPALKIALKMHLTALYIHTALRTALNCIDALLCTVLNCIDTHTLSSLHCIDTLHNKHCTLHPTYCIHYSVLTHWTSDCTALYCIVLTHCSDGNSVAVVTVFIIVQCSVVHCTALHYNALRCTAVYSWTIYYIMRIIPHNYRQTQRHCSPHCTHRTERIKLNWTLQCTSPHSTEIHCTSPNYTALHCT